MVRIEAVTVCAKVPGHDRGYDDFLLETAKHNRGLFSRWVIVTNPADEATREVCRKMNLEVLLTDDFFRDGGFDKGRGINRGMALLSADSWWLHLDADIVLPPTFHQLLELAELKEDSIYTWDRVMVKSWEDWQDFKRSGFLEWDYNCRINLPPKFQVGTRWVSPQWGFVPIGYAQMAWSGAMEWRGTRQRQYPFHHSTSARTDVQFGMLWDRPQRVYLPEVVCYHLDSEPDSRLGANWKGRTTKRFGPSAAVAGISDKPKNYPPAPGG